ncbi:MAG TPA: polyketide synthase dehydratase domain-containing protein, partial [Chthoniobacteraceae bacterium]|nr:polyketide synthase dehydratase domain-containing protein [Chthoniobacteraceae bacterium]
QPAENSIPFFSTVTGQRCDGETCDASHWARGIRQPVEFASAVGALAEFGVDVWLELSAHPALVHSIHECLAAGSARAPVLTSARREREHESVLEAAMDLHRAGVPLDFAAMTPSRRLLSLPAYPWDRSRWWNESSDWREGRLAPGGRGLLEVRLPRATPTWIARLDSRHMAFLKDHRVESHVIFPAAAFVEMALEAGVQLFEGRPFVIEDFEIRKPLILPDPPSGLLLEISYEANERTFAIQSRFDHGAAWSVHVVGSMRGERTEAGFAASAWERADGLQPVEVENFYGHMSDMGLRYGEEFRPIRELSAGGGRSAGKVSLSAAIAKRAGEYPLHPVLFDGALQVFSAGAATVEDRKARLKLPVRFSKILFLRSPGASSLVRAGVQRFNDDFLEGEIGLFDEAGQPCVLVDGFRAISLAGARRSGAPGGSRELIYHVAWERTPAAGSPSPQQPVPLQRLHEAARGALENVLAVRDRADLVAAMDAADDLTAVQLARGLREMGATTGESFSADSLAVAEPMRPVFECLLADLADRGLLEKEAAGYRPTAPFENAANTAREALREFIAKHPGHLPDGLLCAMTGAELGPILRGEKDAVQVLFAGAGADVLEEFYGDGLLTAHWLAAVAGAVQE